MTKGKNPVWKMGWKIEINPEFFNDESKEEFIRAIQSEDYNPFFEEEITEHFKETLKNKLEEWKNARSNN